MIIEDSRIFFILQKNKVSHFLKIFKDKNWPKIFVFICFLLVAFVLAILTYFFSKNAFFFAKFHPEFAESVVFYTLLAWFFLIFLLTFGSSFTSAMGIFFIQDDDDLLLSFPIRNQIIFESRFINLVFQSSWPIAVFGIPLLLAFNHSFNLDIYNFIFSVLVLILILVISSLAASILAIKIISFTGQLGKKLINVLGLISLPILAWWTAAILIPPGLQEAFRKLQLEQINQFLRSLPINSNLFPSTWAVNFIFYWQENPLFALFNLEKILGCIIILTGFAYWLVNAEYFYALAKARIGHFIAGPHDITQPIFSKKSFPYFLKGIKGAFLEKDILLFTRSQAEIFQAGFILFIVILYFLLLSRFPLNQAGETLPNFSINSLIKSNFIINSYILAIISLRFIFPSISLEGQSSWLIWSAPFSKTQVFWQKLFTGWGISSLASAIVSFFSALILKLNLQFFIFQFSAFVALSLTITSISLGIGTIFPNFEEKNPEKISTSAGGILATGLSLFYIFIFNFILFYKSEIIFSFSFSHAYIWLISIISTFIFTRIALSKIDKYQF